MPIGSTGKAFKLPVPNEKSIGKTENLSLRFIIRKRKLENVQFFSSSAEFFLLNKGKNKAKVHYSFRVTVQKLSEVGAEKFRPINLLSHRNIRLRLNFPRKEKKGKVFDEIFREKGKCGEK